MARRSPRTVLLPVAGVVFASLGWASSPGLAAQEGPGADPEIEERRYCTQFGPFSIRFDRTKAAGIYAIVPNGHLGTLIGSLDGTRIAGRWHEATSAGEIEIEGAPGWQRFTARYRTDDDPDRWYEDWRGVEQPPHRPTRFTEGGLEYLCERTENDR